MVYEFDPRVRYLCITLTATLLLWPGSIYAQEVPQQSSEYTIAGMIRDALGSPLSGVSVCIQKTNLSNLPATITDEKGEFFLSAPSEGAFALRAEKSGFREAIESVTIPRKERVRLEIVLVRSESQPVGDKSLSSAATFSDSPNFTIAGVTDWTAAGGHGSDVTLRTSEAFARETHGLGTEASRKIASRTV